MKNLDRKGSDFCSYQAKIFSKSLVALQCSSKVFLRRFFNCRFAQLLDFYEFYTFSFDEDDCFKSILEDYGDSSYGKEKLPEPVLHYIGYITRYICYTRNVTSLFIYHTFGLDDLISHYEVFHTQSEEYVINELLRINNLTEDIFDEQKRLKKIILEKYNNTLNKF